jgi:hypothetical protein
MAGELERELQELELEFQGFEDLALQGLDPATRADLEQIDQLAQELGLQLQEEPMPTTLSALTSEGIEAQVELQFVGSFVKNKVKKLLEKLIRLVKKYAKCASCVPLVLKAATLFKAKKYFAALKAAYDAYKCIKKCAG